MFLDIVLPFLVVGLAELGDKTQLAILLISSNTKAHLSLLGGVAAAFLLTSGVAVLFGAVAISYFPFSQVRFASGILFILFGFLSMLHVPGKEKALSLPHPFLSGFTLILFSEMGDKSQIATVLFATRFQPVFVFAGVFSALFILSAVSVYIGKTILPRLNPRLLSYAAATVFILMGLGTLFL